MRFFLVFCFYAALGCGLGVYNLWDMMLFFRDPYSQEFPYFILPFTVIMYYMKSAAAFEILYVGLINFGLGACGCCIYLFFLGMTSVLTGKTPHEEKKKAKMLVRWEEPEEDTSAYDNFLEVFGQCGFLHFLVPLVPFDAPKPPVGYRRIITYNNDYILNGTIHTSEENLDPNP